MSRRPRILAIDAGGSKVDAVLLGSDGRVRGAARVANTDHDGTGGDRHMESALDAVRAACRDAGVDPEMLPVADLGIYCVAGADLPQDDRRISRWLARRGVTTEDGSALGGRHRVRVRDQLQRGVAVGPHVPVPGGGADLG